MARFGIVLKKPSRSGPFGFAPRPGMRRLKEAAIVLSTGLLLIGILIAAFVIGSITAAVVLALLLVSMLILVIRILVGVSRRP
jgi:Flp pilus assembly protein TadB